MSDSTLEKLWRRMLFVVGRGRIMTGDDTGAVQMLQVKFNDHETRDNTPRVAEYGFASRPLPGCHAIVLFVAGDRSNGVVVGTNDQTNRLKNLVPGEAAMYTDLGQTIYLKRTGTVIDCAGLPLSIINAPTVTHDGVNIGKTHTHSGVTAGGGNSGGPA